MQGGGDARRGAVGVITGDGCWSLGITALVTIRPRLDTINPDEKCGASAAHGLHVESPPNIAVRGNWMINRGQMLVQGDRGDRLDARRGGAEINRRASRGSNLVGNPSIVDPPSAAGRGAANTSPSSPSCNLTEPRHGQLVVRGYTN